MSGPITVEVAEGVPGAVGALFVDGAFNLFQSKAQGRRLFVFSARDAAGELLAELTLAERDGLFASPVTGAFGGLNPVGRATAAAAFALVDRAGQWIRSRPAQTATIRLPPDCFPNPLGPPFENALFRDGWQLGQVDLNYYLPVTAPDAYAEGLGETRRKELRRLHRNGAAFLQVAADKARPVYDVIAANRAARGYPMTMSWDQISALATAFPQTVSFFTVQLASEVIAGAICLQVTPGYAYVFYWGESPEFRRQSPVLLLAEGLMAEHHARGVAVLDLGTSTDASQPNPGLIEFKESLRAVTTSKRTYTLNLG